MSCWIIAARTQTYLNTRSWSH